MNLLTNIYPSFKQKFTKHSTCLFKAIPYTNAYCIFHIWTKFNVLYWKGFKNCEIQFSWFFRFFWKIWFLLNAQIRPLTVHLTFPDLPNTLLKHKKENIRVTHVKIGKSSEPHQRKILYCFLCDIWTKEISCVIFEPKNHLK